MILTSRSGDVEVRAKGDWPGWGTGGPLSIPPPSWKGSGGREEVAGVPAADAAVRVASEQVAGMNRGVYRGDGIERRELTTGWQAEFFNGQPNRNESWASVWEQLEASLTAERNGYWWLTMDRGRVAAVQVVDPCLVTPRWDAGEKVFDIVQKGKRETFGSDRILHFRGPGRPGAAAAPNPIDVFCTALGAASGRASYEEEFYQRGMGQAIAVMFPAGVSGQDARAFQEQMIQSHGGAGNQHKPRIFGNGATVQTIGISPRDAQLIEAMSWSVQEVARIYNVVASLIGGASSTTQASGPISPEHEMTRWLRFGLAPRLLRLASTINHSPAFFGAGASDSFGWETADALKGDLTTEDKIAHQQIQDGRLLVNEWRAERGRPPVPGGDVPQFTPVGGAPNPASLTPGQQN